MSLLSLIITSLMSLKMSFLTNSITSECVVHGKYEEYLQNFVIKAMQNVIKLHKMHNIDNFNDMNDQSHFGHSPNTTKARSGTALLKCIYTSAHWASCSNKLSWSRDESKHWWVIITKLHAANGDEKSDAVLVQVTSFTIRRIVSEQKLSQYPPHITKIWRSTPCKSCNLT